MQRFSGSVWQGEGLRGETSNAALANGGEGFIYWDSVAASVTEKVEDSVRSSNPPSRQVSIEGILVVSPAFNLDQTVQPQRPAPREPLEVLFVGLGLP